MIVYIIFVFVIILYYDKSLNTRICIFERVVKMNEMMDRIQEKLDKTKKEMERLNRGRDIYEKLIHIKNGQGDLSGEESRLYLNNERLVFGGERMYLNSLKMMGVYSPNTLFHLISDLSKKADPLCAKIIKILGEDYDNLCSDRKAILNGMIRSKFADKILRRTMTEPEYFGYLNGKIPICRLVHEDGGPDGEKYFLSESNNDGANNNSKSRMHESSLKGVITALIISAASFMIGSMLGYEYIKNQESYKECERIENIIRIDDQKMIIKGKNPYQNRTYSLEYDVYGWPHLTEEQPDFWN